MQLDGLRRVVRFCIESLLFPFVVAMMLASSTCARRALGAGRSLGLAGGGSLSRRNLTAHWNILGTSHSSRSSPPINHRFKSTDTAASADKCPYHNSAEHNVPGPPKLVEVPALPFVGSLIPQYSGIAELNVDRPYEFWPNNRKKFGDFYQMVRTFENLP